MDNQHKLIKGYRDLSQEEIDLMNRIKAKGGELNDLIQDMRAHINAQHVGANSEEHVRLRDCDPLFWLDVAKHDLQVGLMKLTRSIAQPGTF